jgi:cytidylate kinase
MSQTDYQSDSETYVLAWDMYGLESCICASQIEKERVWNVLANKEVRHESVGHILHMLTMRARFNSQRHYEIYAIDVDPSITKEVLVQQFEQAPQEMAELIRSRGRKLYSDHSESDKQKVKIT